MQRVPQQPAQYDRLIALPHIAGLLVALAILHLVAHSNFLLFHTLVEMLRIVALTGLFALAWHTRHWSGNSFLGVAGTAAIAIAGLELLHTLSYKGLAIFPTADANLPTQLWIAFRGLEALAFLVAALWIRRAVHYGWALTGFGLLGLALLVLVFSGYFPDSFVEGSGLTRFKIIAEYLIALCFALTMILLFRRREQFAAPVHHLLQASLLFNVFATLAFTQYISVYGFANELGHYFLFLSAYLIYRGVLVTGVVSPFNLLFRNLKRHEEHLAELVSERTAQLEQSESLRQTFFQHSPAIILLTDADGRLTLANPAFEKLANRRQDQILGKTLHDVLSPELADTAARHVHESRQAGRPVTVTETVNIDGHSRIFETIHFPLPGLAASDSGRGIIATDVTEHRQAQARIEFLAHFNALTALPNRNHFEELVNNRLAQGRPAGQRQMLAYIDLDNFKDINDTFGHVMGDNLLREIAGRLKSAFHTQHSVIGHSAGDEFMIFLGPVQSEDEINREIRTLYDLFASPFEVSGQLLTITISVGVAVSPSDGEDFSVLFRNADTAMYAAKAEGRNTHRRFTQAMEQKALERQGLLAKLRGALGRGELYLNYQPQFDLANRQIVGAEALLRWCHPELGAISPERFIPIAEESGLIVEIGQWVILEACRQAAAWQRAGLPAITMAVNLSAIQFQRPDLCESVAGILATTGLPGQNLELELTESVLVGDVERVVNTIKTLKQQGIHLTVDDFGTGYSSLAYLQRFAVDKLKIDQSFVRNMATDESSSSVVRAIIRLAHSLGLKVVAEGVETAGQTEQLARLTCDEVQGYHFGKPMDAEEFTALLGSRTTPA